MQVVRVFRDESIAGKLSDLPDLVGIVAFEVFRPSSVDGAALWVLNLDRFDKSPHK